MSADKTIVSELVISSERTVDHERAERAVRELLEAIGEDPSRDGLLDTPGRVARMWAEVLSGTSNDPDHHLSKTFYIEHDEMVLVRDIPFTSVCEHHMLPFTGIAHIAYLPGSTGRFTGLSKLARLVEGYSRRLQVQERLTGQVADAMQSSSNPSAFWLSLKQNTVACQFVACVSPAPKQSQLQPAAFIALTHQRVPK